MDATTPTAPAPATDTPATIPIGQAPDLRTFEDARSKGLREIPNPAYKPAESTEIDPEVAADPELAKAVDEVEAPKPEETPAEKAARTRRNKEAGRKSLATRLYNQREAARQEAAAYKKELEALRGSAPQPSPAAPAAPSSAPSSEPTLKDFPLEKFKDEDDPYQAQAHALAKAAVKWELDQRDLAARAARQRETAAQRARELDAALDKSEADAKARYADYDAVVGGASFPKTPASTYVQESIAESGVFADLAYHLCKHPDRLHAILALPTRRAVDQALGAEIATVKASLAQKAEPATPKVTAAPEPVAPVTAGAGSSLVHKSPKDMTLSEWETHRAAGGGRR